MAAQAQAQQMQAALQNHDRIRRSTELPLWYGRKDKDTVTPQVLLARIAKAAPIAGWVTDERKCSEFYMTLRDKAISWWESLDNCENVDKENWEDVQREFLAAYAPRFTARTTCTNFQDLIQRQAETVHDYYLRVTESFKRMCEAKPAAIDAVRAPEPNGMDNNAAARAQVSAIKKEGLVDMERFFLHQLFIAGLRDDLRSKIMEAGKPSLQESLSLARELEVIIADKKKNATIASIPEEEDLGEDEIEAINAIRFQRGQRPFQRSGYRPPQGNRSSTPSTTSRSTTGDRKCRFCQGNHLQKDCRKRMAAGKPCVDQFGKPYQTQVNAVKNDGSSTQHATPTQSTQQQQQPGLSSVGVAALNW